MVSSLHVRIFLQLPRFYAPCKTSTTENCRMVEYSSRMAIGVAQSAVNRGRASSGGTDFHQLARQRRPASVAQACPERSEWALLFTLSLRRACAPALRSRLPAAPRSRRFQWSRRRTVSLQPGLRITRRSYCREFLLKKYGRHVLTVELFHPLVFFILSCKSVSYCRFERVDVYILKSFKPNAISGHGRFA